MTGQRLLELATQHLGERYMLGALVPKNAPQYRGPWDCAELLSWLVYQVSFKLYGCANNQGDPAGADAYSGFWARDAEKLGSKITVEEAARTPGAALLRVAANGVIGHAVLSDGVGGTVEAHSHRRGVTRDRVSGRRWDFGVLVPWLSYVQTQELVRVELPTGKIWRLTQPLTRHPEIRDLQRKLHVTEDGIFGRQTQEAVRAFQEAHGLVADGEVGPLTIAALNA